MVAYLLRCAVNPDQPRPSIETLLHAFVPAEHVDHTHADAVIALTSNPSGRQLVEEAFGDEAVWLDYQRPGFDMSRRIGLLLEENPSARAVMLAKHGLVTWGATGEESYATTIEIVSRAARGDRSARARPLRHGGPGGRRAHGRRRCRPARADAARAARGAARGRGRRRARGRPEPRGRCFRLVRAGARGEPDRRAVPRPPDQHQAQAARRAFRPRTGRGAGARADAPRRRRGVRRVVPRLLRAPPRRGDTAVPDRPGRAACRARPGRRHRHERARCGPRPLRARPLPPRDRRAGRGRGARRVPVAERGGGLRNRVLAARALQARAGAAARRARRPGRSGYRRGERDRPRHGAAARRAAAPTSSSPTSTPPAPRRSRPRSADGVRSASRST